MFTRVLHSSFLLAFIFQFLLQSPLRGDWALETLNQMSLEEKIGQLFMGPLHPGFDKKFIDQTTSSIQKYHLGSVIMMGGLFLDQIKAINALQKSVSVPLLFAQDAEWGLGMRLRDATSFPKNMTLGAIQDNSLIYAFGRQMGKQCKAGGIHINFAPVADINTDPRNPVIGDRSFGDNPQAVSLKSCLVIQGLQDEGIIACIKHFPGHGDTNIDSHYALPIIAHDRSRLEATELYPFMNAIRQGVKAVMVSHLHVPALDADPTSIASLSPVIVTGLLRKELGFNGLVLTDALNMEGLVSNLQGNPALKAFDAGCDILVFAEHRQNNILEIYSKWIPEGIEAIRQACLKDASTERLLNQRVYKILLAKQALGLQCPENFLKEEPRDPQADLALKKKLFESAITLLNADDLIPLAASTPIALLEIGNEHQSPFGMTLKSLGNVKTYRLSEMTDKETLLQELKTYPLCIAAFSEMNRSPADNFGISQNAVHFIHKLQEQQKIILAIFGSPYALNNFDAKTSILMGYENDEEAQKAATKVLYGLLPAKGKLPIKLR